MRISLATGLSSDPLAARFELVERKGLGHPDTICDAIAEAASRYYAQFCMTAFGRVAHHWFDKVMLLGADADIRYGSGRLTTPYKVIFAGKCAFRVGNTGIPVADIARRAAEDVLATRLTGFESGRDLTVVLEVVDHVGPGRSPSRYRPLLVRDLPSLDRDDLSSNDSNIAVGYSPLTPLEEMVLLTEALLNGAEFKASNRDVGWDIKVIGSRIGADISLLVNVPFLAQFIPSSAVYIERKQAVESELRRRLTERFELNPVITMNPADREGQPYLVALGSVADTGDVGVTGRGNRINGLITPMRPMSIEALAGKNPVDHTGKLYGIAAEQLARTLATALDARIEVFVHTSKGTLLQTPDDVMINVSRKLDPEEERLAQDTVVSTLQGIRRQTLQIIDSGVVMW